MANTWRWISTREAGREEECKARGREVEKREEKKGREKRREKKKLERKRREKKKLERKRRERRGGERKKERKNKREDT